MNRECEYEFVIADFRPCENTRDVDREASRFALLLHLDHHRRLARLTLVDTDPRAIMMNSYQAAAAPSSYSSSAVGSTSDDVYAQFYYWDASANNWAFDYNSYYAAYGYPSDYATSSVDVDGSSSSAASAVAYADPSAAAANPYYFDYQNSAQQPASTAYDATHHAFAASSSTETCSTRQPELETRYDESGRMIPGKLRRGETRPTVLRRAAGKIWEDQTLLEWDPSHKRLFVGDLGNDVSDELLSSTFQKYASFSKARVVRNKDGKAKGYGFVAFADPEDFLKAWKEMDGKYIGSRPCRLKKAADVVNPVQIGARKDKMLAISAKQHRNSYKLKMGGAVGHRLRRIGMQPPK